MQHVCALTQWILLHSRWFAHSVLCGCACVCVCEYGCASLMQTHQAEMMQIKVCVKGTQWPQLHHPVRERHIDTDTCSLPLQLQTSMSPPTYLPLPTPPPPSTLHPFLLLRLLLSSTSSNHPWDCVMRTQFQINRLQRVMKDRGGYERWREEVSGGPKFP